MSNDNLVKLLESQLLVYLEVSVGILHSSFNVAFVFSERHFILTHSVAHIFASHAHVAFANVSFYNTVFSPLTSISDALLNLLVVSGWVCSKVSLCNSHFELSIFLHKLTSLLEHIFTELVALLQHHSTHTNVVVSIVGISSHTLLEVFTCSIKIAVLEVDHTIVVESFSLVRC